MIRAKLRKMLIGRGLQSREVVALALEAAAAADSSIIGIQLKGDCSLMDNPVLVGLGDK